MTQWFPCTNSITLLAAVAFSLLSTPLEHPSYPHSRRWLVHSFHVSSHLCSVTKISCTDDTRMLAITLARFFNVAKKVASIVENFQAGWARKCPLVRRVFVNHIHILQRPLLSVKIRESFLSVVLNQVSFHICRVVRREAAIWNRTD